MWTHEDHREHARIAFTAYEAIGSKSDFGAPIRCTKACPVEILGGKNNLFRFWNIKSSRGFQYLAIGVRGTELPDLHGEMVRWSPSQFQNVATDLSVAQCPLHPSLIKPIECEDSAENILVHSGFQNAYLEVRPIIHETLSSFGVQLNPSSSSVIPPKLIVVIGHSLGGALAQLLALDVSVNFHSVSDRVEKPRIEVISFGKPHVGNKKYCLWYCKQVSSTINFLSWLDPVPRLCSIVPSGLAVDTYCHEECDTFVDGKEEIYLFVIRKSKLLTMFKGMNMKQIFQIFTSWIAENVSELVGFHACKYYWDCIHQNNTDSFRVNLTNRQLRCVHLCKEVFSTFCDPKIQTPLTKDTAANLLSNSLLFEDGVPRIVSKLNSSSYGCAVDVKLLNNLRKIDFCTIGLSSCRFGTVMLSLSAAALAVSGCYYLNSEINEIKSQVKDLGEGMSAIKTRLSSLETQLDHAVQQISEQFIETRILISDCKSDISKFITEQFQTDVIEDMEAHCITLLKTCSTMTSEQQPPDSSLQLYKDKIQVYMERILIFLRKSDELTVPTLVERYLFACEALLTLMFLRNEPRIELAVQDWEESIGEKIGLCAWLRALPLNYCKMLSLRFGRILGLDVVLDLSECSVLPLAMKARSFLYVKSAMETGELNYNESRQFFLHALALDPTNYEAICILHTLYIRFKLDNTTDPAASNPEIESLRDKLVDHFFQLNVVCEVAKHSADTDELLSALAGLVYFFKWFWSANIYQNLHFRPQVPDEWTHEDIWLDFAAAISRAATKLLPSNPASYVEVRDIFEFFSDQCTFTRGRSLLHCAALKGSIELCNIALEIQSCKLSAHNHQEAFWKERMVWIGDQHCHEWEFPSIFRMRDNDGMTVLDLAKEKNHSEVYLLLAEVKAVAESRAQADAMALNYVDHSLDVVSLSPGENKVPLLISCVQLSDSLEKLRILVDCGSNVMAQDKNGWTCLHWAAAQNMPYVTAALIEVGGSELLLMKNRFGHTCLHIAVSFGSVETIQTLLKAGGRKLTCQTDCAGLNVLHWAAKAGQTDTIRMLSSLEEWDNLLKSIQPGHDPSGYIFRPPFCAIDPTVSMWCPVSSERCPLKRVLKQATQELRLFSKAKIDQGAAFKMKMALTCPKQHVMLPDTMISGCDLCFCVCPKSRFFACKECRYEICSKCEKSLICIPQFITNHDFDSVRATVGWSCLHWAAVSDNSETVTVLIEKGGSELTMVRDKDGMTCLHWAARVGNLKSVQFLVGHGGKNLLEAQDNDGRTCLHWASWGGFADVVVFLLECGGVSLFSIRGCDGMTSLDEAVLIGERNVAAALASSYSPPVTLGSCFTRRLAQDKFTIEVRQSAKSYSNLLQCLLMKKHTCFAMKIILQEGHEILKVQDSSGETVLHTAARLGLKSFLNQVLSDLDSEGKKTVLFCRDAKGSTCLHHAAAAGETETAVMLAIHGKTALLSITNLAGILFGGYDAHETAMHAKHVHTAAALNKLSRIMKFSFHSVNVGGLECCLYFKRGTRTIDVRVFCCDILKLKVDSIVYGASAGLDLEAGLARYITCAAGSEFKEAVGKALANRGKQLLAKGEAISTGSGLLKNGGIQTIIHAVISGFQEPDCRKSMGLAVNNALNVAEHCKCRSVAIPLMGSGKFGWPAGHAAEAIAKAVVGWLEGADSCNVREIFLVDVERDKVECIRSLFEVCLDKPMKRLQSAVSLGSKFRCLSTAVDGCDFEFEYKPSSSCNSVTIKMTCSDLLTLRSDTVIYGANPCLILDGGLGGCIAFHAGPLFEEAVRARRGQRGLSAGDAFPTEAGGLLREQGILNVIHAVVPGFREPNPSRAMGLAVRSALTVAGSGRCRSRSVAIPLMGSGRLGWPAPAAAEVIVRAVVDWLESGDVSATGVCEIVLFDMIASKVAAFVDALKAALRLPVEGLKSSLID